MFVRRFQRLVCALVVVAAAFGVRAADSANADSLISACQGPVSQAVAAEFSATVVQRSGAQTVHQARLRLTRGEAESVALAIEELREGTTGLRYTLAVPATSRGEVLRRWQNDVQAAPRAVTDADREAHPWVFDAELLFGALVGGYRFALTGQSQMGGVHTASFSATDGRVLPYPQVLFNYKLTPQGCAPLRAAYLGLNQRAAKKVFFHAGNAASPLGWDSAHVEDAATLARTQFAFTFSAP